MFVRNSGTVEVRRVAAACLALFYTGSTAALIHADSVLDGQRMGSPVHVESPESGDCAVHTGHVFCQVVRSLSHAGISYGVTMEDSRRPPIQVVEVSREREVARCAPILFGSVVPRGPPTA